MHFNNNEFLRNKVIINPQYLVDLMVCLVSINNNYIKEGRLYHADLPKIWHKYDTKLHEWILKLTERFDLTFSVPEQSLNFVPCLMPDSPSFPIEWPDIQQEENINETQIVYQFEYLPAGLFNRVQVRLYQLTNNKVIWKNGSLLNKNNHLALITISENKILIKAQGLQPENIIFLIHEVIEVLIAESFNGVAYDYSFPCPDCFSQRCIDNETSMYSASLIRRATQKKAVFLQCRNNFHVIPIVDLHARMPPDSADNYDLQLRNSVRELQHLKQRLTYDIVIVYSHRDAGAEDVLHPRIIKQDLERLEFKCWFSEMPETVTLDSMAIVLRNASLIIFCLSDNFANDEKCIEIFNYAKGMLEKAYLLVVLGRSMEWQKTNIGALVTDEFFVKINTIER